MAVIHHTTLRPAKVALLTHWLPSQPWYAVAATPPVLTKAGGFRLDDPAGEVGIEFMVVTDQSGTAPVSYHVPMTYRSAPLAGAEQALIGQAEHGVLGPRWVYDGARDPVLLMQLAELVRGGVQAQAQSVSDTRDPTVVVHFTGADLTERDLRVIRRLQPNEQHAVLGAGSAAGYVEAGWQRPDGSLVRGRLVLVQDPAVLPAQ